MNRKAKRELRKDKDLVKAMYEIIKKYLPELFSWFKELEDTRNKSYITYDMKIICVTRLFALLCGITSMNGISDKFNTEESITNMSKIVGCKIEELPHHDTVADVFENLSVDELRDIQRKIVVTIIRSKMFDKYRYKGGFLLVFDGTGLNSFDYNLNNNCLYRKHKDGTISYYKYVLEAKIIVGSIVISLDSEFIENTNLNTEKDKQDCETKAFKRMAERIKKNFPKLRFIIAGDALYATTPIINICEEYKWFYIFNLKKDRLKVIYEDFIDDINCHNETIHKNYYLSTNYSWNDNTFNVIKYIEESKKKTTEFHYITNLKATDDTIKEIVVLGRSRWKIENEGFNQQKNGTFNISHLCSRNENATKAHYLFIQFAHTIRQLLEKGHILIKELRLKIKEVSEFLIDSLTKSISSLNDRIPNFQLRFDDLII